MSPLQFSWERDAFLRFSTLPLKQTSICSTCYEIRPLHKNSKSISIQKSSLRLCWSTTHQKHYHSIITVTGDIHPLKLQTLQHETLQPVWTNAMFQSLDFKLDFLQPGNESFISALSLCSLKTDLQWDVSSETFRTFLELIPHSTVTENRLKLHQTLSSGLEMKPQTG